MFLILWLLAFNHGHTGSVSLCCALRVRTGGQYKTQRRVRGSGIVAILWCYGVVSRSAKYISLLCVANTNSWERMCTGAAVISPVLNKTLCTLHNIPWMMNWQTDCSWQPTLLDTKLSRLRPRFMVGFGHIVNAISMPKSTHIVNALCYQFLISAGAMWLACRRVLFIFR